MAELHGIPLHRHLEAIASEYRQRQSIYGYPRRKMFLGFPDCDFSVDFHGRRAATPLGPASGPHTQMAQNIILAFLGGGRIMELKTVQILDRLQIPRPCIDVRNVGYNVEWSQELRLQESYQEYVHAWILLKIIEAMELLGIPRGDPFYDTVFDLSVGYDLKGISSPEMHRWLQGMQNAGDAIPRALANLPPAFAKYRNLEIPADISNSVTLSTFHGCPREEIERIVEYLIREHGFHVIVKMNPTILGYDAVRRTLHEDLGYSHVDLDPQAFAKDLQFEEAVAMMKRLESFARQYDRTVGAKFTNTLVVKNHEHVFKEEVIYLSGPPLHVLAMQAMHRFRREVDAHFQISFSAGITKHNFVDAVRCHMKPITTCTDLLKTGGYTRLFAYLKNLQCAMEEQQVRDIDGLILNSAGAEFQDVAIAGVANADRIVPALVRDRTYHADMNRKTPPKIDSHLRLFDCITCNKCLPVCPTAANFSIRTGAKKFRTINYRSEDDELIPVQGEDFVLEQEHQIANLADFCNECGNCDTYCPELGGPFIAKPRFFWSRATYEKCAGDNGFYFSSPTMMIGRINGQEYQLAYQVDRQEYTFRSHQIELRLDQHDQRLASKRLAGTQKSAYIDMRPYYIMRTLMEGLLADQHAYPAIMLRQTLLHQK